MNVQSPSEAPAIDFTVLSGEQLTSMQQAADDMIAVLEEVAESEGHILLDVVNSTAPDPFTEWQHYPPGDVHDRDHGALWFYHAHAPDEVARPWDEHGHFHLFVWTEHVAPGVEPIALPPEPDMENGGLCHLVAISFDPAGVPARIFTTNRWVAMEWQYPAEEVIRLLDKFIVEKDQHRPTSRWLMAALKLFRPQIEWSLRQRDKVIDKMRAKDPDGFSEDTSVEVLSSFPFDFAGQIDAVETALDARR